MPLDEEDNVWARQTRAFVEQHERRDVIVVFISDMTFDSPDGTDSLFVPEGTKLIGRWANEQTEDEESCTVEIGREPWDIPYAAAQITCPLDRFVEWGAQEPIAQEHFDRAKEAGSQGRWEESMLLYARSMVEYEACGMPRTRLAKHYLDVAFALLDAKKHEDAIAPLEKAAAAYEEGGSDELNRVFGAHLDYAVEAARASMLLMVLYILKEDEKQVRKAIGRLLALNKLIKKRYETKVEILLTLADGFSFLEDEKQALDYLMQAKRFYSQQLAREVAYSREVQSIAEHLGRLESDLQDSDEPRAIKFTLTAATSDDLDAILSTLRESNIADLVVTRSGRQRSKSPRQADLYTANIRITVRNRSAPARAGATTGEKST